MIYDLEISDQAECDLDEAAQYIAFVLENPDAAAALIDAVEAEFATLTEFPHRGTLVNDKRLAAFGIRFVTVKNYHIFFQINEADSQVYFLRILYAKRDWANLLMPKFW